jgi:formylglycine-generating enzyme
MVVATPVRQGMRWVPGGTFSMGDERFYPEEGPVREVRVEGFWVDETPVTVAAFRRFVKQTGHVTVAERPLDPDDYPEAEPALLNAGLPSHSGPVDLSDARNWWEYVPGASWKYPEGPRLSSTVET